jgi:hypothetical protein
MPLLHARQALDWLWASDTNVSGFLPSGNSENTCCNTRALIGRVYLAAYLSPGSPGGLKGFSAGVFSGVTAGTPTFLLAGCDWLELPSAELLKLLLAYTPYH